MSVGERADPPRPLRAQQCCGGSWTFKIVEVASGAVLADGVDMRATVELLSRIDSIFDVAIAVWDRAAQAWRPLSPGEQRALWDVRGQ